jgi:hypothetical protein
VSPRKPARPQADTAAPPPKVLQLKVTLWGTEPPVWRQVLVPSDFTFEELHGVIQGAMGWGDDHLHEFRLVGPRGRLGEEIDEDASIGSILSRARQRVAYQYDFGDSWLHEVLLEKALPYEAGVRYPVCLGGARACPPEDCGGLPGYYAVLEALREPTEDNAELREWIGDEYAPEAFDPEAVNKRWAKWRKPCRG